MKQVFYTQEGRPYVVKVQTRYISAYVLAAPQNIFRGVYVNSPSGIVDPFRLDLSATNNIIPISYSFGAITVANVNVANISCCYFSALTGPPPVFLPNYRTALAKAYPFIERIFYTDALNYNFVSRYNQITFSNDDFLVVNNPFSIYMHPELDNAMVGPVGNIGALAAATYNIAITFTFLEIQ